VPVAVAASPQVRTEEQGIEVELRRGAITIKPLWPIGQATELAAFTRELLR
jgi:transposase